MENSNNPAPIEATPNYVPEKYLLFEKELEPFFTTSLPPLPDNVKEAIVKYAPIVIIIGLLLSVPLLLAVVGLGTVFSTLSAVGGYSSSVWGYASILVFLALFVMRVMSVVPLRGQMRRGWVLVYYSIFISAGYSLMSYQLGGFIIGAALSLYIAFQVRSYYTK